MRLPLRASLLLPLLCLSLGPVRGNNDIPRAIPVPVQAKSLPSAWRFGEALHLVAPEILWSQISLERFPVHVVREGLPVFSWDDSAPWPGRFVPDVSMKTLLDSPREIAKIDTTSDAPSFWDAAQFWHLGGSKDLVRRFFCTVYYTPLETGFTAERGFDMTPETRSGLGGRKYARSFLKAVKVEGFGRLKEPFEGKGYVKYDGRWGYHKRILGNRNNTLLPRRSAAVHRRNPLFTKGSSLTILDPNVFGALGTVDWRVDDTGGGLHWWQIDLYWDEDDPLGPGIDIFRPRHCPLAVSGWIPVAIIK